MKNTLPIVGQRAISFFGVAILMIIGAPAASSQKLSGAGSPAPYPLLARWFELYEKETGQKIGFQAIGAGAAMQQMRNGTVDFLALASPLEKDDVFPVETQNAPFCAENIAVVYNLPQLKTPLKLNAELLNAVARGNIKRWNHPRLVALNPQLKDVDRPLHFISRDDGSGVNYALSRFLFSVDKRLPITRNAVFKGGFGGRSCDGISSKAQQIPGALAYVESIFATQKRLRTARILHEGRTFGVRDADYPIQTQHFFVWRTDTKRTWQFRKFLAWSRGNPNAQKLISRLEYVPLSPNSKP